MKRKSILGVLLVILLVSILALVGCGKSDGKSSGKDSGTLAKIKERGKIIVGVKYDSSLFGYMDPATRELTGFDIDMTKLLAKKLLGDESKVEFVQVTSKTRIPLLNSGDVDVVIATMTITEERKKEVDFTDPYVIAGQSLLVHIDSTITGLEDLKGKTVIAVKGSTSGKNVSDRQPDAIINEYDNYTEAFTALKTGKGEALTTDNFNLMGLKKQDPSFKLVGGTFTDEPYGMAVRKGDTEFLNALNEFVKEFRASEDYVHIYEKAMGEKPTDQ